MCGGNAVISKGQSIEIYCSIPMGSHPISIQLILFFIIIIAIFNNNDIEKKKKRRSCPREKTSQTHQGLK